MKAGVNQFIHRTLSNLRHLLVTLMLLLPGSGAIADNSLTIQRIEKSPFGNFKLHAINDILQDKKGFVWLATENGLLRYDSLRTIKYDSHKDNPNSLSSQYCWSLAEDHRGHIWIATENGLNEFDPVTKKFTRYLYDSSNDSSLSHNFTTRVIETSDHLIYVATADGLTRISEDRKQIQRIQAQSNQVLLSNNIRTLMEDSKGFIWIGYYDKGATRWDPATDSAKHFANTLEATGDSPTQLHIRDIAEDNQGRIWLGSYGAGVTRLDLERQQQIHYPPSKKPGALLSGIIWDIFVDSKGSVWVAMDKGGVARFDEHNQKFITFKHDPLDPNTLLHNTIKAVDEDRQGNLWFATFPTGLNRHHPTVEQFTVWYHKISVPNTLSHSTILALAHSSDGMLWVGTEDGLNALNEKTGKVTRYMHDPEDPYSLPAAAVLSIAEGPGGDIWVGTWSGGLAKLNRKTGKFDRFRIGSGRHSVQSPNIWKVFFDSKQRLWLATETDGINYYDPQTDSFTSYIHNNEDPNSISFDYVWDITEKQDGQLWVGTQYGLNLFNPESGHFQRFDEQDNFQGLGNSRIQALLEDREGYVWVATHNEGVKRWDPNTESIINLTVDSGLPDNTVSSLQQDNQGFIWAGTVAGIVKINPHTLNVEELLTHSDGIAGDNHNRNASLLGADGALYFGSSEGITKFSPSSLDRPINDPSVTLTDVRVLNRSANVGEQDSPLNEDISKTPSITLDSNAAMLSLEFTSLDFNNSGKMRFSYRLDGFDRDWNITYNRNEAIYTNLDPGEYLFKVRAQKQNGQWSDNITRLRIVVKPPLWLSPLAYVLYALVLITVFYLLIRVVLLRLMTARLNAEVQKRTVELNNANSAKTQFLANMSHDLRTPLNSIIGFSKRLIDKYDQQLDKQGINALEAIHRNGQHLLGLINDILDLSKIESGKMELKFTPCNLKEIITGCVADLNDHAIEKGLTVLTPSVYVHQVIRADAQRLTQILYNLLSNAIKYTNKGHIAIMVDEQVMQDRPFCTISVIDTGIGIRKEDQDRLFKRFEQVDDQTRYVQGFGTGLGLALVAEFASLHGGHVSCHSIFGEGSQFTLFLPLPPVGAVHVPSSTPPRPASL